MRVWSFAKAFIETLFSCRHPRESWPQRDKKGKYTRCLDCGRRFPWSWGDKLKLKPPRLLLPGKDRAAEELEHLIRGKDDA